MAQASGYHATLAAHLNLFPFPYRISSRDVDRILAGYPDQTIARRGYSRVEYGQLNNLLLAPLSINGIDADYVTDSGSDVSVISQTEAKRLGLKVHPFSEIAGGYGLTHKLSGVAVADRVTIGEFELRHVAFMVDDDVPPAIDGILGLPVLIALETMRWNSDGTLEIGVAPQPKNIRDSNLCFTYGLLASAAVEGRPVMLDFDTGSDRSLFFRNFADEFPALMRQATKKPHRFSDTQTDNGATELPEVNLTAGAADLVLRPAPVLREKPTSNADFTHGHLGMDLLTQARSVTMDLSAMRLVLAPGKIAPRVADDRTCRLPPEFACREGWTCAIEVAPDCAIHRVEEGDDLPDPDACTLPARLVCPPAGGCLVHFEDGKPCRLEVSH
jgi:hypothetical protein